MPTLTLPSLMYTQLNEWTPAAIGKLADCQPGTAVPDPTDIDLDAVRVVESPDPRLALKEL